MLKISQTMLMGQPDKVCDQVADAIVDEFVRRDKDSVASIQVFGGHGAMMISGSVNSRADFDCAAIAKKVYKEAGYSDEVEPFVHLGTPSYEHNGSFSRKAARAQAVCYGYATNKTREMLPPALSYSQALAHKIDEARVHDVSMQWLRPDGRVMVACDGPKVKHVSVFCQHVEGAMVAQVHGGILQNIIYPVIGKDEDVKLFVNPAGTFVKGGLESHTGQSGRRVASDLYGGLIPHAGTMVSGRDASHPARSGTYMARHIAKSIVAAGKASQAFVSLVYTVGRVDPIVFEVHGDKGEDLSQYAKEKFDLSIEGIIEKFDLRRPMFRNMTCHGHFGRSDAPWEEVTELQ